MNQCISNCRLISWLHARTVPVAVCVAVALACPTASAQRGKIAPKAPSPTAQTDPLGQALATFERSEYASAEQQLKALIKGKSANAAWLGLARLLLTTGRFPECIDAADKSAQGHAQLRPDATALKASALAAQGKTKEAITTLESVSSETSARRARLLLGELLIRVGKRNDAREPLMTIIEDYNRDAIGERDAEGLALVARAASLLRSARDANDAFNQSERAGAHRVETLLWRADLFLEKYDVGHAEEVVKEALRLAPEHPDALVLMARVKLEQSLDFGAAEALVLRALRVNPRHTGAFAVRAGLALRDYDLTSADAAINEGLRTDPNDLNLLSLRAATKLLADDRAQFDATKQRVFALNPEYSTFYQIVGDFAEWEHRYDDIVAMMQQAVKVDPRDGKAWAVLGLNLIRSGDDQPGVEALRRAWNFDKFNVRVFNTLNLFEKDIPNTYETLTQGRFRMRYDKTERPVLERYVPAMLEEAFSSMVARYGITPTLPVGIELYSSREHFSVRTSGLPNVGIQGVCFGKTLAAISPKGEPFNWGNVLWHELGHVFAIQMSKAHVPRWFTEGLSEYETFVRRPEWQREEDAALFAALKAGRVPAVAKFNRAFTHAENPADITVAYYAASQIVTYIAERYGMPKIVEMLRLWGQGLRDPEVVKRALGIDVTELDRNFHAWLTPRMQRYEKQFMPDLRAPALEQAKEASRAAPKDPRKQLELAVAAMDSGDAEATEAALARAEALAPKDPNVRFLRARLSMVSKDAPKAQRVLEAMVQQGHDGYAVRMMLADIGEARKEANVMRAHLEAARRLDPTQSEALEALYDLAKKEKRQNAMVAALRELSIIDQHERRVYARLMNHLADMGQWEELRDVGARAVFVDVTSPVVHKLYGKALAQGGDHKKAVYEFESGLLSDPSKNDAVELHTMAAASYGVLGDKDKARLHTTEASSATAQPADAEQ